MGISVKLSDILTMCDYNYWATEKILNAAANLTQEQLDAPYGKLGSLRDLNS